MAERELYLAASTVGCEFQTWHFSLLCQSHVRSEVGWCRRFMARFGAPSYLCIVRLPETNDHCKELLAAVRKGSDGDAEVRVVLQNGQSLRAAWHEDNDGVLIYTCLFNFGEKVACTLIASGANVTGNFDPATYNGSNTYILSKTKPVVCFKTKHSLPKEMENNLSPFSNN